jgi:type I restriction enzyme M protein
MRGEKEKLDRLAPQAAQKNINIETLRSVTITLPSLAIQHQIVAELEAERKMVEVNRALIARMEAKIKAKLAEVWGEK